MISVGDLLDVWEENRRTPHARIVVLRAGQISPFGSVLGAVNAQRNTLLDISILGFVGSHLHRGVGHILYASIRRRCKVKGTAVR